MTSVEIFYPTDSHRSHLTKAMSRYKARVFTIWGFIDAFYLLNKVGIPYTTSFLRTFITYYYYYYHYYYYY